MKRGLGLLIMLVLLLAAPAALALEGDYNGDGVIDDTDQALILAARDTGPGDPGFDPAMDHNGDGAITLADVSIFRKLRAASESN